MKLINLDGNTLDRCKEINGNPDYPVNIGYAKGGQLQGPHIFRLNGKMLCSANTRDDKLLIIDLIETIQRDNLDAGQIVSMIEDMGIYNPQGNDMPQPILLPAEASLNGYTVPGTHWVWDGGMYLVSAKDLSVKELFINVDEALVRAFPAWIRKVQKLILDDLVIARSHSSLNIDPSALYPTGEIDTFPSEGINWADEWDPEEHLDPSERL